MRHGVLDVKMTVLRDTNVPVDLMTQILSHAKKIASVEVRRVRGFGVVFTHPSLKKESPLPVSETPCNWY